MTDALKDEFPDPETELAFLDFLATEWPNWRHHVGSDYWHIRRRSFLAGRPAPQALAATPAVSDEDWATALNCAYACFPTGKISRSELDNAMQHAFGLLSLRIIQAATPAVGGERERYAQLISEFYKTIPEEKAMLRANVKAIANNIANYLRAQPASPLRGREPTVDEVRQTVADEWGSSVCYHDPINLNRTCDKGANCRCADIARAVLGAHSFASPPEQPEFQRTNPLDTRLSPIEPFTGNYKGTKE